MPDVVDVAEWNRNVSELKEVADKLGASFHWDKKPNGKEVVVVEQWYTPQKEMMKK